MKTQNSCKALIFVGTEAGRFYRGSVIDGIAQEIDNGLPHHPEVRAIVAHPRDASLIYVGTQNGPYRSIDQGRQWQRLACPEDQIVWSITFHPDRHEVMYLGTEEGAIYRSDDSGDSWAYLSTITSSEPAVADFPTRVLSLAVDSSNPSHIYAGLEVGGVARTTDGGLTWQAVNKGLSPSVDRLDVHGVAVTTGYVFISNREGIWRSGNQGESWDSFGFEQFPSTMYSRGIRVAPDNPSVLYACIGNSFEGDEGGVLRSTNLGKTWSKFDRGPLAKSTIFGLSINAEKSNQVYFCTRKGQILGTNDGGHTWDELLLPDSAGDVVSILITSTN